MEHPWYNSWEVNADYVKDCCDADCVNYTERYYHCPECGELIYEIDWTPRELDECICPICEWEGD